jgi:hypothetical protein
MQSKDTAVCALKHKRFRVIIERLHHGQRQNILLLISMTAMFWLRF